MNAFVNRYSSPPFDGATTECRLRRHWAQHAAPLRTLALDDNSDHHIGWLPLLRQGASRGESVRCFYKFIQAKEDLTER